MKRNATGPGTAGAATKTPKPAAKSAADPADDEDTAVPKKKDDGAEMEDKEEESPEEEAGESPEEEEEEEEEEGAEDPDDEEDKPATKAESKQRRIGAKIERKRIAGILDAREAKGREKLARRLAFKTGVTVADAVGLLKEASQETRGSLAAHMSAHSNADIGADGGGQPGALTEVQKTVASIMKTANTLRGRKAA